MFLIENNLKKCLLLISLLVMVFITSCAEMAQMLEAQPTAKIDVPPPQAPQLQTFKTSDEYLKAGKASFDAQRFDEAQAYLTEAVRLDQKNQPAHLLLGVTYVKMGKGAEARKEFDKTVQLDVKAGDIETAKPKGKKRPKASVQSDVKTGDAETARSWLKRLDNPLAVGILPPRQDKSSKVTLGPGVALFVDSNALEQLAHNMQQKQKDQVHGIKNYYYSILSKTLTDCGFYSINELHKADNIELEQNTIPETNAVKPAITMLNKVYYNLNRSSIIANLNNSNIKILIEGSISEHITLERGLSGINGSCIIGYNIELYSVKDSRLIKSIANKVTIDKITNMDNIDNILSKANEDLFKKMALEIHNALL